ncbi:MAG: hypothetical protein M3R30_06210 [Candidatus Eremiobacteraeota bacterium]|nr:hypothetical protein [Candidatus Eremiobacteraeota bacterium]
MKKTITLALAAALLAGALSASPSRAAGQYPIKIETKAEAVSIIAYAPQNQAIRMSVWVPRESTRTYALENADYYEFRITLCGKTHTSRWNRGGTGVVVTIHGCDSYGLLQQR